MRESFERLTQPPERRMVADAGRLGAGRPMIHGLVEFDVTEARRWLRDHKARTGEALSFTAFLVACLARAIAEHPRAQAAINWRGQVIVFDDVDVVTLVEPAPGATAFPHILRAANRRSVRDLHDEIRRVQTQPRTSGQKAGRLARIGPHLPGFVRGLFYRALRLSPLWMKRAAGTVIVTAVGMFFQGAGWGFGFASLHNLVITIGGIAEKPAVIDGQIVPREFLCLTISLDHTVVDGADAARFAAAFKALVESAGLLEEVTPQTVD